eukprot:2280075-Amphidinium_carterae.1
MGSSAQEGKTVLESALTSGVLRQSGIHHNMKLLRETTIALSPKHSQSGKTPRQSDGMIGEHHEEKLANEATFGVEQRLVQRSAHGHIEHHRMNHLMTSP